MNRNDQFPKFPGFPSKPQTNFWCYPRVMNGWWHILTGSEQKVLDYLLRHTWGYAKWGDEKTADFISYSQFLHGIKNKTTGEWVDRGCGIKSSKTLAKALKGLITKGFVEAVKLAGKTTFYQLKLIDNEVENKEPLYKGNNSSFQSKEVGSLQSKDTIKDITIKDTQQSEWVKKYGNGITELISRYSLKQVDDAIKITEAKIRRGERVDSPIGYITALCRNKAKWEDTDEAKGEKYLKDLEKKTKQYLKNFK